MEKIHASVPDPVHDAIERVSDIEDKSESRVISERLEEQLIEEGEIEYADGGSSDGSE